MKIELTAHAVVDGKESWADKITIEDDVDTWLIDGKPAPIIKTAFNLLCLQFCEHQAEIQK